MWYAEEIYRQSDFENLWPKGAWNENSHIVHSV